MGLAAFLLDLIFETKQQALREASFLAVEVVQLGEYQSSGGEPP